MNDIYPLHQAVINSDIDSIESLIQAGVNVEARDAAAHLIFKGLIYDNSITPYQFKANISTHLPIEFKLENGNTPLHVAVLHGQMDSLRTLIKHGADVNSFNYNADTPLNIAIAQGHADIVVILIDAGANVNIWHYPDGRHPLLVAAAYAKPEVITLLKEHGADLSAIDYFGRNAMHYAAKYEKTDNIKLLHQYGVEVDHLDKTKSTALHLAATHKKMHSIKVLMEQGADVNKVKNYDEIITLIKQCYVHDHAMSYA